MQEAQGDKVVALGHYAAKSPAGRSFESDFVMVFTLRNGKGDRLPGVSRQRGAKRGVRGREGVISAEA